MCAAYELLSATPRVGRRETVVDACVAASSRRSDIKEQGLRLARLRGVWRNDVAQGSHVGQETQRNIRRSITT